MAACGCSWGAVIENTARKGSTGPSGDLSVTARNITLSDPDAQGDYSLIATRNVGSGTSGVLTVHANTITVGGDAAISVSTYGPAAGGSATIDATTAIQIFENGSIASDSNAAARGGILNIRTGTLSVAGVIQSNAGAQGDGGDIEIQANQMTVSPTGQVLVQVAGSASGSGGQMDLSVGSLLVNGGVISAGTYSGAGFGLGRGGIIEIQASNSVTVLGTGQIAASTFGTGDAGDVRITTRDLLVSGGAVDPTDSTSLLVSTIAAESELGSTGRGGSVQINASGTVQVRDLGQIDASTLGTNSGGAVSIAATGGVQVLSGGSISSNTFGSGRGGYVRIVAPNLLVSGEQTDPSDPTGTINSSISTDAFDRGSGGRVIIQATGNVSVLASGYISADTLGAGNGGSVTITAAKMLVSGTAPDGDTFDSSYVSADSLNEGTSAATGHGGDVRISASDSVQVRASGSISADAYSLGGGGSVIINSPTVLVSGFYQNPKYPSDNSASEISVSSYGQGSGAGELVINGKNLTVSNTATVTVTTSGSGAAGDMDLTLSNSVDVLSGGSIAAESTSSGRAGSINIRTASVLVSGSERTFDDTSAINDDSGTSPRGNGSISIRANQMTLSNGGFVSADTFGPSDAGTIRLSLADSLQIVSGGGIFGNSEGKGRAANITISAPQVEVSGDSSSIASDAADLGAAGRISIQGDQLVVSDGGEIATLAETKALAASAPASLSLDFSGPVQIFSNGVVTATTTGAAPGGDLTLTAGSLSLDGSTSLLTARSLGTSARAGVAGRLSVTASGDLTVSDGGLISTQAVNAAGGSISLTTGGNLRLTSGSAIDAQSVGGGGNVDFNVDGTLFALNSGITASTVGATAQGGTVTIGERTRFLILNETAITAKAEQGLGGNIINDADFTFATADRALAIPPAPAFDPNGLINPFDTASASGNLGAVVTRSPNSSLASTLGEVTYRAPDLVVVNQYPASEKQLAEAKAAAARYLDTKTGGAPAPALPPAPVSKVAGATGAAGTRRPTARPAPVPERHTAERTGVPAGTPRPERAEPSVVPSRVIAVQVSKKSDTSSDTIGIILVDPVSRRVASPDVYEISRRHLESGDSVTIEGQSATLVARDL